MASEIGVCILIMPVFQPNDPPPAGYMQWHEWARVQIAAGLRQLYCVKCGVWKFPKEREDCVRLGHDLVLLRTSEGRRRSRRGRDAE